jgi:hypothetical protein
MAYYSEITAAAGDPPPYPRREDFTTHFAYAGGKPLGSFPTIAEANKAGAVVTEKIFAKDRFEAAQKLRADFNQKIVDEWFARVRADYPHVSDALFNAAYHEAYSDGHSYGYDEVEMYVSDYIDFALKVIDIAKTESGGDG